MSLINEALKKAERERATEQGSLPPMGNPRSRVAKRGPPMKTQKILLIVAGALLLVVVSAVLTGVFVTHKVDENKAQAKIAAAAAAPPAAVSVVVPVVAPKPPPVVVARIPSAPVEPPPPTYGASSPKPAASASMRAETADPSMTLSSMGGYVPSAPTNQISGSASSFQGKPAQAAAYFPPTASSAPAATSVLPTIPQHDPHIQTLVDGFHVSGIRSAGNGSKVLMNDRVFRVNDIVDYTHGLRLIAVSADTLTFVDTTGETYTKNF